VAKKEGGGISVKREGERGRRVGEKVILGEVTEVMRSRREGKTENLESRCRRPKEPAVRGKLINKRGDTPPD